jgi:alkanesulfonate monooxygenase SsuD/methylene tetrahydromethanopterin reductase-like flavin-dependent oxidoreductase (luciferase family)
MVNLELWNHCENPSPFVPAEVLDAAPSVRASLPSRYCEPEIALGLYDEAFEEHQFCDDSGLHIVTNEHHSGINNLWAAAPVITGIVAWLTKEVRILTLGTLVMVRPDPVRIRERAWEAIDLIKKSLTSHDGPFSWEGKFFTHVHVNVWPRT